MPGPYVQIPTVDGYHRDHLVPFAILRGVYDYMVEVGKYDAADESFATAINVGINVDYLRADWNMKKGRKVYRNLIEHVYPAFSQWFRCVEEFEFVILLATECRIIQKPYDLSKYGLDKF